jgi:LPXTG-motif cell wall-anchored protein
MDAFHQIMNWFLGGLLLGAIVIGAWFYKKKKESDR